MSNRSMYVRDQQKAQSTWPALFRSYHQRLRCWLAVQHCSCDQPSSTATHLLSAVLKSSRLHD